MHDTEPAISCPVITAKPMSVSRETQARIEAFIGLLTKWNRALNLVSHIDIAGGLRDRHIGESLAFVPHLPTGSTRFTDFGSGGGFPAIPIAIATGWHVDLIEADQRKAAFLQMVLVTLEIAGTVWPERIETCAIPPARCVTARAVAPLIQLLEYTCPKLEPGGVALFLKGDRLETELVAARLKWRIEAETIPISALGSRLLKVSRLEPADDPAQ